MFTSVLSCEKNSPLYEATIHNQVEIVKLLLTHPNIDVNKTVRILMIFHNYTVNSL